VRTIVNPKKLAVLVTATAVLLAVGIAPASGAPAQKKKSKALVGLFEIEAGTDEAAPTGSYFRMVQSGGTVDAGPFVPNGDSTATDKTYTLLSPGTDGGLLTGTYQEQPEPPFDAAGNGLADAIVAPPKFFGVSFAMATNETDPQTGATTKKPSIKATGKKLSGNLSAVGVAYGDQHFNQGAPKPKGAEGETTGPSGTYNAKTGAYTLEWSSTIVGGPFDGFTGIWHLEGTFTKQSRK
jgi:hypothetical protein